MKADQGSVAVTGTDQSSQGLSVRGVSKSFDGHSPVLDSIDLDLATGETLALLGPSGCGKSTLLRIVAGLESADEGRIHFKDRDLDGVPPEARKFGFMFQDYALFPHRNVEDNIGFGLEMAGMPRNQRDERIARLLEQMGLGDKGRRSIDQLSGGERQRVALARSLAPAPRLLMLDEPLANLDRHLRERLSIEIQELLERLDIPAIYVTHDQDEAFRIADRIALMNEGRIVQIGRPQDVYDRPANEFVARFLGHKNILTLSQLRECCSTLPSWLESSLSAIPSESNLVGETRILIRSDSPYCLLDHPTEGFEDELVIQASLEARRFAGAHYHEKFLIGEDGVQVELFRPVMAGHREMPIASGKGDGELFPGKCPSNLSIPREGVRLIPIDES